MWLTIANGSYKIWTTFNLVDYIVLNADCSLGVSLSNVVRNIPRGSTACSREKMWNKLRGFCCATQWLWIWCWCHRCIMQPRAKPSVKKRPVDTRISFGSVPVCFSQSEAEASYLFSYHAVTSAYTQRSLHIMWTQQPPNLSDKSKHQLIKKVMSLYDLSPIIVSYLFI